jgi:hypothetical protein
MEGLRLIPYIALMLLISGVILAASLIGTGKFGDTLTQCYNTSYVMNTTASGGHFCTNTTIKAPGGAGKGNLNLSDEYYAIVKAEEGLSEVSGQIPTVGIIAIMVIIISVIAGVFVYMRYFG